MPELFINHSNTIEIDPNQSIYAVICNAPWQYHCRLESKYCDLVERTIFRPDSLFICFKLTNTNKTTTLVLNPNTTLDKAFSALSLSFIPEYMDNNQK